MDLRDLAPLYEAKGPFVTVVLDTTSEVEDAATRLDINWRNTLRELEEKGVDEATREALSANLGEHGEGNTRVLVAASGEVLLALSLPDPPESQVVNVGPLPTLLALAERASVQVPHVVALVDRLGADVMAYGGSDPVPEEVLEVKGPQQHHIRKVHAGGWSSRRYEETAENFWERNAEEVASAVDGAANDVQAQLVVLAGDDRAVNLLQGELPERLKPVTTVVQGTRHADGGDPFTAQRIVDAVAERLKAVTDDLLAKYEQERAQNDKAVDGPADTLAALRMAQVDVLVITTQLPADATAWFDAEQPGVVGLSRDDVTGLGGQQPQEAPLVDVLLRAALGTGATVRVVSGDRPDAPQHGVGALLRFPVADETVA
ncbi:MAG: hypothetical protein M3P95_05065 [Actinomycetota bacterium]|nr:hypothetical protein [Actinomycetota bacterium]